LYRAANTVHTVNIRNKDAGNAVRSKQFVWGSTFLHLKVNQMATLKIQTTAYAELAKGKSNEEVLEAVFRRHPNAKTTLGCISYYRSKMNKELDATQRIT